MTIELNFLNCFIILSILWFFEFILTHLFRFITLKFFKKNVKICPVCGTKYFLGEKYCINDGHELFPYENEILIEKGKVLISKDVYQNKNVRICFECDWHYHVKEGDQEFIYCPYCGKKTYGFDEESLQRFDKDYPDLCIDEDPTETIEVEANDEE